MAETEPEAAGAIRGFYVSYWMRVRMNLWGDVHEQVVPVLLGRFQHEVNLCVDGIIIIMRRASTDSFVWRETQERTIDRAEELLGDTEDWKALGIAELQPGSPNAPDFDFDIARKREEGTEQPFDRVQVRCVPFDNDYAFWTPGNAERLAARNLKGPKG